MQKGIYFILTIFLAGVLGTAACHKTPECKHHIFRQYVFFSPRQEQVHTGDTIWMSSNFNCSSIMNEDIGLPEDFCEMRDFTVQVDMQKLEPSEQLGWAWIIGLSNAVDKFQWIEAAGAIKSIKSNVSVTLSHQKINDKYEYRIGLIPQETGQYVVTLYQTGKIPLMDTDNCDTGSFKFWVGNKDPHIELVRIYLNEEGTAFDDKYAKSNQYCFEVLGN